eukprot:Selendium_serpulae@DN6247_c0_g4_i1.p1
MGQHWLVCLFDAFVRGHLEAPMHTRGDLPACLSDGRPRCAARRAKERLSGNHGGFGMCRQTTTNSTDQSFNSKSSQILVHNSLKNYCSSHKSQKVRTRITSKGCYVEQKKLNLFYQLFNHIFYLFYSFNTASPGRQSMLPVGVDPSFGLRRPLVSALPTVHTSIFTEMSRLAAEHGAINLSQGFPDFPPDPQMTAKLEKYSREGHNQFAPTAG